MESGELTRRDFLHGTVGTAALAAGLATAAAPAEAAQEQTMLGVPFEPRREVRMGIIGVGGRGQGLLRDLLAVDGVRMLAVCDVVPDRVKEAQARITAAGQPRAEEYGKNETDFERLCARGDLDLIYIATPWDWHVPMAVCAMENGVHAGVEVPAATTLDECWKLVRTSERTRRHCVILENCCYGYNELLVLNMIRDGLLGELTHAEAAYIHDLRGLLFANRSEGLWRRFPHMKRNANLYPTHGLGPVAWYLGIHKGDRFDTMVSMSSPERSLGAYGKKTLKAGDPRLDEKYICGDMNTSIIRTALGRTIMLQHDVVTPRPYSRINMICGTNGTFADYPPRIYIDGVTPNHDWGSIDAYKAKYEHPLWKRVGDLARKLGGHGGMDFLMSYRLIECMKKGEAPEMDVYDAAAWSAPTPLSEASVRKGGAPQKFPDFTRGHWKRTRDV